MRIIDGGLQARFGWTTVLKLVTLVYIRLLVEISHKFVLVFRIVQVFEETFPHAITQFNT